MEVQSRPLQAEKVGRPMSARTVVAGKQHVRSSFRAAEGPKQTNAAVAAPGAVIEVDGKSRRGVEAGRRRGTARRPLFGPAGRRNPLPAGPSGDKAVDRVFQHETGLGMDVGGQPYVSATSGAHMCRCARGVSATARAGVSRFWSRMRRRGAHGRWPWSTMDGVTAGRSGQARKVARQQAAGKSGDQHVPVSHRNPRPVPKDNHGRYRPANQLLSGRTTAKRQNRAAAGARAKKEKRRRILDDRRCAAVRSRRDSCSGCRLRPKQGRSQGQTIANPYQSTVPGLRRTANVPRCRPSAVGQRGAN